MADFFKGLSGGFQTGLQLGQAVRERRQRDALAEEAARYGVTEGAFGPELQQNIQQLEGLKAQDPAQAAAYDQAIGELQRRAQMTAPDFTVASRGPTFATREEAQTAARPMRTAGLANVYRQFGDLERADELESRAQAQELAGIQIDRARRTAAEERGMKEAQLLLSGAEQAGQPITSDFLRVVANQTGANFNQLVDTAAKSLGFTEASATARINQFKRDLSTAANKGVTGLNEFLAANFDPNQNDNIKPEVTKDARGNFVVTYGGQVLPQYGTNKSLNELIARTQANIDGDPMGAVKTLLQLDLLKAQIGESQAKTAAAGRTGLRQMSEADITTRARAMVDLGTPDPDNPNNTISFAKALQIVRQEAVTGVPYESAADRIVRLAIENQPPAATPAAPAATPAAAATPTRGLFTDPQGRTQLLEPFSRFGDWRRRLVDEANARDAASGLSSAGF